MYIVVSSLTPKKSLGDFRRFFRVFVVFFVSFYNVYIYPYKKDFILYCFYLYFCRTNNSNYQLKNFKRWTTTHTNTKKT